MHRGDRCGVMDRLCNYIREQWSPSGEKSYSWTVRSLLNSCLTCDYSADLNQLLCSSHVWCAPWDMERQPSTLLYPEEWAQLAATPPLFPHHCLSEATSWMTQPNLSWIRPLQNVQVHTCTFSLNVYRKCSLRNRILFPERRNSPRLKGNSHIIAVACRVGNNLASGPVMLDKCNLCKWVSHSVQLNINVWADDPSLPSTFATTRHGYHSNINVAVLTDRQ